MIWIKTFSKPFSPMIWLMWSMTPFYAFISRLRWILVFRICVSVPFLLLYWDRVCVKNLAVWLIFDIDVSFFQHDQHFLFVLCLIIIISKDYQSLSVKPKPSLILNVTCQNKISIRELIIDLFKALFQLCSINSVALHDKSQLFHLNREVGRLDK